MLQTVSFRQFRFICFMSSINDAMSNLTHHDDRHSGRECSESAEVEFILSLRVLGSPWGLEGFLNCKTLWFDGWSLTRYDLHSWLGIQYPVTKVCLDRWTPGWCSCWCSREGRCQRRRMRRRRTCCTPWLSSAAPPPSPSCCSSWQDRYLALSAARQLLPHSYKHWPFTFTSVQTSISFLEYECVQMQCVSAVSIFKSLFRINYRVMQILGIELNETREKNSCCHVFVVVCTVLNSSVNF